MKYRNKNDESDWAKDVPDSHFRSPYEDYGWERDTSVLPQFRDPAVHLTEEERRRMDRSRQARRQQRPMEVRRGRQAETQRYSKGEGWDDDQPEYGWSQYYGQPFARGESNEEYYGSREAWMNQGPYSGRGPRSYRRSDDRIFEDVCQRLTQHGMIDARQIQVEVREGEVILDGTVDNRQTKRMVEDTIDSITGVKDIHNRLTINPGAGKEA